MFGRTKKLVMCHACRGLIEASVRTCPLCGRQAVPSLRAATGEGSDSLHFFSRLILSINVVLFILMAVVDLSSGAPAASFITSASDPVLTDFGGRYGDMIARGQWWRLVTPIFLHLGVVHLMFNSIALYVLGPQIEEFFGSQKLIFIYLATGIAGNIGSFVFNITGAGASGAIYGLLGVGAVYGYRLGGAFGQAVMRQMIIWIAIGMVLGLTMPGIDVVNHVGGLLTGAALGFVLEPEPPATSRAANTWNLAAIGCAALITVSFVFVALNYGKAQRGTEVIRLDRRFGRLEAAVGNSLNWTGPAGGDPHKLAGELRAAATDLESIQRIDDRSDELRRRLVNLAARRASLLDAADQNAGAAVASEPDDYREADAIRRDYDKWARSIAAEYHLVFETQRGPRT